LLIKIFLYFRNYFLFFLLTPPLSIPLKWMAVAITIPTNTTPPPMIPTIAPVDNASSFPDDDGPGDGPGFGTAGVGTTGVGPGDGPGVGPGVGPVVIEKSGFGVP
jgi:hypothetical protein